MGFQNLYEKHYKKLLIIPILLFVLSSAFLIQKQVNTGFFIDRDFSIAGGTSITVSTNSPLTLKELESYFAEEFPNSDISVKLVSEIGSSSSNDFIVESSVITKEDLLNSIEEQYPNSETSIQEVGPGIGQSFFKQMMQAVLFAFILMGLVVFITFRKFIPCLAILLSAFLDIFVPLAVISLLEIKLSMAGIAAFLLVIGYSIDTDILLTSRLLKRKHEPMSKRLLDAFKTGITMTLTTLVALTAALIIAWEILVLRQMFTILIIALIMDIISTWIMNAPMLIWYLKKNENK